MDDLQLASELQNVIKEEDDGRSLGKPRTSQDTLYGSIEEDQFECVKY